MGGRPRGDFRGLLLGRESGRELAHLLVNSLVWMCAGEGKFATLNSVFLHLYIL